MSFYEDYNIFTGEVGEYGWRRLIELNHQMTTSYKLT